MLNASVISVDLIAEWRRAMNNNRYGMIFNTLNEIYYYDSGNGKVINCEKKEGELILQILNGEISLEDAYAKNPEFYEYVKEEKLFACPEKRDFLFPEKEEFKELVNGACEQIILELTECCNLRCGYCIYHDHHPEFRGFSDKNMDFEVARKSLDYILRDYKREEFALTFYGGEPLINFEVMKQTIDYAKLMYPQIQLNISFTTNLTLLTQHMVDYFKSLNDYKVSIMCSIDGPKIMHDRFRRDLGGNGSFDRVMAGLNLLLDGFHDEVGGKTISINCVMAPPYSKVNLETANNFFYKDLKLSSDIKCNYVYLDQGDMVFDFNDNEIVVGNDDRMLESCPLEEWAVDNIMKDNDDMEYFDIVSTDMSRIASRMCESDVIEKTYLHGNCIPGQRRIYVTVDGEFKVCEKVGSGPSLGDYKNGYNHDRVYRQYIEEYAEYFKPICNQCWARPVCAICYERTMNPDGIIQGIENKVCEGSRRIIKDLFVNYFRLHEEDSDLLKQALEKYEFS